MDISNTRCQECKQPMKVVRMACPTCKMVMEGEFGVSPLAQLAAEDQTFVMAFVRYHGSLKRMEGLFGISYPTVKNRLNAIAASFDKSLEASSGNIYVLEQLARGEITVEEALERLS